MKNIKNKKFLLSGGTGFLGKNIIPYIIGNGGMIDAFGSNIDLTKDNSVLMLSKKFDKEYDYIIHAAVLQGASDYPLKHKAEQYDANMRIHTNMLSYWHLFQPEARFIGIGSSCSYPDTQSILYEENYWDGPMHESVDVYGLTKKAMNVGIEAYKSQYGLKGTTVVFATLYGPNDCFELDKAHVVAALIRKFIEAKNNNKKYVEVWGDGNQTRELIYVEDQIMGLLKVIDFNGPIINIGTGVKHTIKYLAETIKNIVGYNGSIAYNPDKFVGVKHKVLNIEKARFLFGWTEDETLTTLKNGIQETVNWYLKTHK